MQSLANAKDSLLPFRASIVDREETIYRQAESTLLEGTPFKDGTSASKILYEVERNSVVWPDVEEIMNRSVKDTKRLGVMRPFEYYRQSKSEMDRFDRLMHSNALKGFGVVNTQSLQKEQKEDAHMFADNVSELVADNVIDSDTKNVL